MRFLMSGPLSKGFLAGKEEAGDIQISDAAFYRKHGIAVYRSDVFDLSYEFWGDVDGHDQVVYRGNMNQKQLSVWWLKNQTLCAASIMNHPEGRTGGRSQGEKE
jgi:hypothetical protein